MAKVSVRHWHFYMGLLILLIDLETNKMLFYLRVKKFDISTLLRKSFFEKGKGHFVLILK